MNLFELKIVLKQLRQDLKCPHCASEYPERKIQIVGTHFDNGMFLAECKLCANSIMITVSIERKHRKILQKSSTITTNAKKISIDEVLDIKNFLSEFNGDLSTILTK